MLTESIRRAAPADKVVKIIRGRSHDPFAAKLQDVMERQFLTVQMIRSAADARRDLSVNLPSRLDEVTKAGVFGWGGVGSEIQALLDKLRSEPATTMGERESMLLVGLLDATVESLVTTNDALSEMAVTVARQLVGEPGKLISGSEMAELLGIGEEAVRLRHRDGKLLAILSAGRERGRGFPIFQAWDGIAGQPLEQILLALGYEGPGKGDVDAAEAFQFFVSRNDLLGDFTPVEVLTGAGLSGAKDPEAAAFLAKPPEERLEFVKQVADAMHKAHGQ